jgi:acetaldehyde dehydrogenase
MLVNVGGSLGGVGATTNLAPAFTLGCGAVGGSSTSDNVSPMNLINIRRVAVGVRELSDFKKGSDNSNCCSGTTVNSEVEDMIRRIIAEYRR